MFDLWSLIVGFVVGMIVCSLAFGRSEYKHREKVRRKMLDLEDELSQSARREALHRADAATVRKTLERATKAGIVPSLPPGRIGTPTPRKPGISPALAAPYGKTPTRPTETPSAPDSTMYALAAGMLASSSEPSRSEPAPTPEPAPSYTSGGGDSGGGFSTGGSSPGSDFSTGGSI